MKFESKSFKFDRSICLTQEHHYGECNRCGTWQSNNRCKMLFEHRLPFGETEGDDDDRVGEYAGRGDGSKHRKSQSYPAKTALKPLIGDLVWIAHGSLPTYDEFCSRLRR